MPFEPQCPKSPEDSVPPPMSWDTPFGDCVSLRDYGISQPPAEQCERKLTPLDLVMPRLYGTRWILCFPLEAGVERSLVFKNLRLGLARTIGSIPWIAGVIAPETGAKSKVGRIQVVESDGVKFHLKDLCGILPSYHELKKRNFPLSEFSTKHIAPIGMVPEYPFAVMVAQANFIEGGLLLTIGLHHSVCDATGFETIIRTWADNTAAAVSGSDSFSIYSPALNDRMPLMEGKPGAQLKDFPEYVLMPTPPKTAAIQESSVRHPDRSAMTTHVFYFSPESLGQLKSAAAAFSTNDALIGLVWQHMTIARNPVSAPLELTHDKESRMLYAVNVRSRMRPQLPANWLGNATICGVTDYLKVTALLNESGLSTASTMIRKSLNTITADRIDSTIGLLNSRDDPYDFKFKYNGFLGPDIVSTSFAHLEIYKHDWGPCLGKIDAFRIPGEGTDGTVGVFPRLRDGGLEVLIGLEDGAMERLLRDAEFGKYAQLWA
ncbi:Acyltransferase easC [Hyphodiscus hymeniophilus]|uniref:Acyltransferase easC n=1 Tax=Hyphodiscus hymeniophilus TaxID=353542 RepID=A0A9P6VH73_9HELO|nr:Acyltransferase easC [Hyphodiscus hymeniophilus]